MIPTRADKRPAGQGPALTPHAAPVDRIIAATALSLGAALVTKDDKLRSFSNLKTIW